MLDKLDRVEKLLLKHQPGRHNQQRHAGTRGGGGGAIKPAEGRVDEPGFKYSSEDAAQLAIDAIGVKNAVVEKNYWQDDTHRVTLTVPVEGNSRQAMQKSLRANGFKGGGWHKYNKEEWQSFRNKDKGVEVALGTTSGTGGGQVYGYRVDAYIDDSYRDAMVARGEELPSYMK